MLSSARTIAEKNVPRTNTDLINILDSEGSLLCRSGKFAEAEKRWRRAVNIAEHTYGEDGVGLSALLLHLGQLYTEIHDYPAAEKVLERGLSIEQQVNGADQMDRAIMMSALGNVYLQQHKVGQAEPLVLESIKTIKDNCESVPLACAALRTALGDYYMLKSQWQAAEGEYKRALTMRENSLGDHPLVASTLMLLSRALRKLKRKKEANVDVARAEQIMSLPQNAQYNDRNETIDVRSFRSN